jgi:transposase
LEEPSVHTITTIGLDIAKSVFQVHGIDAQGHPRRRATANAHAAVTGPGSVQNLSHI